MFKLCEQTKLSNLYQSPIDQSVFYYKLLDKLKLLANWNKNYMSIISSSVNHFFANSFFFKSTVLLAYATIARLSLALVQIT